MTTIVETLIEVATADTELLLKNQELGDDAMVARNVDFIMYGAKKKDVDLVGSFITDFGYGTPTVKKSDKRYRLTVTITMPTTQPVLCTVSGFMACLASIYDMEYDGWEADVCIGT
ncbi:ribonuclease E inhibitor RraB [Pirellulaceae bacterium SH467]|jgi:hypothetical protein